MNYQFFKIDEDQDQTITVTFVNSEREMNILSSEVLMELDKLLDDLYQNPNIKGLIFISGKKDQFIVGADVSEINSLKSVEDATKACTQMQAIFQKVAKLNTPTIAAIHGNCLGGGLELALAFDLRVASDDPKTQFAFPEIQLGLIPGAGGTQRAPRLVGIQTALDLILTGKRYSASKAKKCGLVDAVTHPNLLLSTAKTMLKKKDLYLKQRQSGFSRFATDGNPIGRSFMQKKAKEMVMKNTKGFYPAAKKALNAVFSGYEKKLIQGLEVEAKIFGELSQTSVSKSLIHLFHTTTALKKHPYVKAGLERFDSKKFDKIGIVGAGFMGRGIATVAASKNIRSFIVDPNEKAVGSALKHSRDFFNKLSDRKKIKKFQIDQKLNYIFPSVQTQGLEKSDIVIEAVFEDLGLKQKILADLESKNPHNNWIFASNTSALPLHKIASNSQHPERILGMHFFSPVEKMPLLEIVKTEKTADWALARAAQLGFDLGKQVIIVNDGPGFYTTRALAFYLAEAVLILSEGVPISSIDEAITQLGYPIGPLALIDDVGIDVGMHVLETIAAAFPSRLKLVDQFENLKKEGYLGRKNNKGFYVYQDGKRSEPNNDIYKHLNIDENNPKVMSKELIQSRCHLLFVNEAIRCLEDGILATAGDGDVGAVFGLGFPPFMGGPFFYCDQTGHSEVIESLNELASEYGERFKPAKRLLEIKNFF